MKNFTPKNKNLLSNRLGTYSALVASMAGLTNADGQILYTDIADLTVNPGETVYIDVDQNMVGEFRFITNSAANFNFIQPVSSDNDTMYNANAFIGTSSPPYEYPSNLTSGATIGPSANFIGSARGDLNYASCGYPGSNFCDGMDGYMGLRLAIGANTHYGWVRIQVAADNSSIVIKDFAYEQTPDAPINAGQTLSIEDQTIDSARIVSIDERIELFNLPSETSYTVYDISGKTVLTGFTANRSHTIDANFASNGVYIIELKDEETSATLRKKIVL